MSRPSLLLLLAVSILAQGCAATSVGAHRYLATGGPDLSGLTLAQASSLLGVVGYETHAVLRNAGDAQAGWMAGAGIDLSLLSGHPGRPYFLGGVEAGAGTGDHPSTWSSWSVGIGGQLVRLGPLGLRIEGRYRRMTAESRRGLEIGVRVGRGWSAGAAPRRSAARPAPGPVPLVTAARAGGGAPGEVRATVVNTALAVMGTPYRWGGSDSNGFDCSGLIQFAYLQAGISLPRQSGEQAAAGTPVERDPAVLLPGDILAFATSGSGAVSHVGLYLGEGRFIHSATGGVQVSVLSATDPYGRWWFQRWVGVRRVVGGER